MKKFLHAYDRNKAILNNLLKVNPIQEGLNYLWQALCLCDESIAPSIISIIQRHHHHFVIHSVDRKEHLVTHNDFFEECMNRLKHFQATLSVIKTTEGDIPNQKQLQTKICRVIDVLRQYVAQWPYPRSPGDAVPLRSVITHSFLSTI